MKGRRAFGALLSAVFLACCTAHAQDYPTKPIKFIVPAAPGGGNEAIARAVAQSLSTALGQQVLVENRGGAGGNVGTEFVARSAPDGYTLLLAFSGPLAMTPGYRRSPTIR
jgi:tripartite-type tricarboxylate transporter receptor subunit TctC